MSKLCIVVPYRNREEHLKKFIPHMNKFLKDKYDFKIIIVEQGDNKPFNRAKLLNVGFNLTKDQHDLYCFHDIDMLPTNEQCDYSALNGVSRLSYYVSQFNFIPRPEDELGGVILIDKQSFLSVNGYCNNYFGWGVEDNDFYLRCKRKNIPFVIRKGKYFSLFHKPNGDTYGDKPSEETINNRNLFSQIQNNTKLFDSGLNNLNFELIEKNQYSDYDHYKVKL